MERKFVLVNLVLASSSVPNSTLKLCNALFFFLHQRRVRTPVSHMWTTLLSTLCTKLEDTSVQQNDITCRQVFWEPLCLTPLVTVRKCAVPSSMEVWKIQLFYALQCPSWGPLLQFFKLMENWYHFLGFTGLHVSCTTLRGWIKGTALSLYTANHKHQLG